ncbi:MAG: RagB/SusD family nutrient uptake outer membrane protein [Bacteroidales bacterium]|nr:RagB/SusD family nutrient uptake outer membrane protein [Bacteroidales bacterium]
MKLNYKSMLLACLVMGGTTACTDNLEIDQHGVQNYETYYDTDEQIEAGVVECYQQALSMGLGSFTNKAVLDGDFWCGGGQRGDNGGLEQLNEYRFSADHSTILSWFSGYYTGINRCNIILDRVPEGKSSVGDRARAEAKVFRGLFYFELASMWGDVPCFDHVLAPSEYAQPNVPRSEIYKFIQKDLSEAISSGKLYEKRSIEGDADQWRVSKAFAQALLGKAYLWDGDAASAGAQFDQVLSNKNYALYGGPGRPADERYENVIQNRAKNNCESIFESQQCNDPSNWIIAFTGCMLRWRAQYFDFSGFHYGNDVDHTLSSYYSGQDYGFYNPQSTLYEDFVKLEGKDGLRLCQTLKTSAQLEEELGLKISGIFYGVEDLFMWKWRSGSDTQNPGGYAPMSYTNNYRWMRLAEVYLLGAEAYVQSNNAKATEYLNCVRRRAGEPDLASCTLADIQIEKRCELCGEGVRYQDIQRWGIAKDILAKQGEKIPSTGPDGIIWDTKANNDPSKYGYKTGKHELLPIPFKEVQMNENIKQNPGWGE